MRTRTEIFESLGCPIKAIVEGDDQISDKITKICELLRDNVPEYEWVGLYLVDKLSPEELVLGPFAGEDTEHKRIKIGKGICGRAAFKQKTLIIDNVCAESNYLACNPDVKSEIVVPIIKQGKLIGEIDIDSNEEAAFSEMDEIFLGRICELISPIIERLREES